FRSRVAALARLRRPRPVDPVAVALPGPDVGEVGVPAERVDLLQLDAHLGVVVAEEAELDALGHLGEQGEVGAGPVVARPEGVGADRPDLLLGHRLLGLWGRGEVAHGCDQTPTLSTPSRARRGDSATPGAAARTVPSPTQSPDAR